MEAILFLFLTFVSVVSSTKPWYYDFRSHLYRVTSQGGQDGLLNWIFSNIGIQHGYYVEFGFNAQVFDGGSGSNTFNLFSNANESWTGLLLDGEFENSSINLRKEWVSDKNICGIFRKYNVPLDVDYVSIDLDSVDLWVFRALLSNDCEYRPRVFSVEYNSILDPESTISIASPTFTWEPHRSRVYGASKGALELVANLAGYSLVGVVRGLDLFFVRNDLLSLETPVPNLPSFSKEDVFLVHHWSASRKFTIDSLMDVKVYLETGSKELAKKAILEQEDNWKALYQQKLNFEVELDRAEEGEGKEKEKVLYEWDYTHMVNIPDDMYPAKIEYKAEQSEINEAFALHMQAFCDTHLILKENCVTLKQHAIDRSLVTTVLDYKTGELVDFRKTDPYPI